MNEALLRSVIRQRHEQIKNEVTTARLRRPDRACSRFRVKGIIHSLSVHLIQWTRYKGRGGPALDESKSI